MKTLLFSNQGLSPLHFGIELEIAAREKEAGNDLSILYCSGNLESCYFNPSHNLLACTICESRVHSFYNYLNLKTSLIKIENIVAQIILPQINTIEDIFTIKYKGYDIGKGLAASYISSRRNYEYNNEDIIHIQEMGIMAANVIENIEKQIHLNQPDKIILFNGRFAEMNAIIEVCKRHEIDYYTFERSSAPKKYKLFKNVLPHSISYRGYDMERLWKEGSPFEREKIAVHWFDSRLNKNSEDMKMFLAKQKSGQLPESFDPNKENIAIFIASEDEHKAVKEHHFPEYNSQNEAIIKILDHFKNSFDITFYLRIHPHLRNLKTAQVSEIQAMKYPNLHIIQAHDNIDTYELMKSCDKIITFGSTTGIEATYHGKASISFGNPYYKSLDCCYYPKKFPDLFTFISTRNLEPKQRESTYKFAYYQSMVGEPYNHFNYKGKVDSSFNSKKIKRLNQYTIPLLVKNLTFWKQWSKMNMIIFKEKIKFSNAFKLNSHVLNEKLK